MSDRRLILDKVRRKEAEVQSLEEKLKAAKIYLQALKDVLAVFPASDLDAVLETPQPDIEAHPLRPGSAMALARDAILETGKPMHVDDLLKAAGKQPTRETKTSLGSALSAYVRRSEVFTRPAVSTFGLIELQHFSQDEEQDGPPPGFGGRGKTNGVMKESEEQK